MGPKSRIKSISVVGLGKLGLPLALVMAKAGFNVVGIDTDHERQKEIQSYAEKRSPEPHVTEYLKKYRSKLTFTEDYAPLCDTPIVFVLVQTPTLKHGFFDMQYIESAVQRIHERNPNALIAISSTLAIGEFNDLSTIHESLCYNPEMIRQGSIIRDYENGFPGWTLIGAESEAYVESLARVWRKVHRTRVPILIVKPAVAEIVKTGLNLKHSLEITFTNAIGELCQEFQADPREVVKIMDSDGRKYLPGLGFSGPCFPRDLQYFDALGSKRELFGVRAIADTLLRLNEYTVSRYVSQIESHDIRRVGILGLAYKPKVPYVYYSQALMVAKTLLSHGYQVFVHDPLAEENAKQTLGDHPNFRPCSLEECVKKAELVFIGNPEFAQFRPPGSKLLVNPWVQTACHASPSGQKKST